MPALESFITNTGFPVFIAMYLLLRFDRKLDMLVAAFVDLTDALTSMMQIMAKQNNIEMPQIEKPKIDN